MYNRQGYLKELFHLGCESGYYGHMCIQCGNCLNNALCDSTSGICMTGCDDGWMGDYCTEGR